MNRRLSMSFVIIGIILIIAGLFFSFKYISNDLLFGISSVTCFVGCCFELAVLANLGTKVDYELKASQKKIK